MPASRLTEAGTAAHWRWATRTSSSPASRRPPPTTAAGSGFGPDGFLYVGTGDSQRRDQPQDRNALGGKILRLTADGEPARATRSGNPVYSLGHRNVQGLAWDSDGQAVGQRIRPRCQ